MGLFMYLPIKLFEWLRLLLPVIPDSTVIKNIFEGVIKIAIFVGYMSCMRLLKDIRRTFMYTAPSIKRFFAMKQVKSSPLKIYANRKNTTRGAEPRL